MKPVIFYVDDEPMNLAVFEQAMPDEWTIKTFDSPMAALTALNDVKPAVILSDQRMPGTSGVQFLEIATKISPHSVRIVVTGYSDEQLVIDSVRKAHVFDYITKPWDSADLETSVRRAVDFHFMVVERERLMSDLREREQSLRQQNENLTRVMRELEVARDLEKKLGEELSSWVHPLVLDLARSPGNRFPIRKDLVGITFDIISSSELHGVERRDRPVRGLVMRAFSELVLKYGGLRESSSGDSAYAHFGLSGGSDNPYDAAMAVAREFRPALRSLSETLGVNVEVGIALHVCQNALVDVHTVTVTGSQGTTVQKSFDTTSPDIDLLHRMEKMTHSLQGTNIILSEQFVRGLSQQLRNVTEVGQVLFKGQKQPVNLFLLKSDRTTDAAVQALRDEVGASRQLGSVA